MRKTTRIDMHLHTRGSDGLGTPETIVGAALDASLDGFVITDHHRTYTPEGLAVAELARESGLVVLSGCEYSTSMGHLLIYGVDVDQFGWGRYPDTQRVVDEVNAAGGRCVPAHPYKRYQRSYGDGVKVLTGLAGVEVANGQCAYQVPHANALARGAAAEMGVPGVGGSDAHLPRDVGIAYTRFSGNIRTDADLLGALDAGNFTAMISRKRVEADRRRRRGKPLSQRYYDYEFGSGKVRW